MSVVKVLGEIYLDEGIYIGDPGCNRGRKPYPVQPGKYTCKVYKACDNFNEYVASIGIYLNNIKPQVAEMKRIGNIGVDSGLAGFSYNNLDYDALNFDTFLGPVQKDAWISEYGFYGDTGGDGLFDVYALKNSNGIAIAVEIRLFCNQTLEIIRKSAVFEDLIDKDHIVLPEGISEIPDKSFCRTETLKSIVIPNGVKVIRESAFAGCSNLFHVELPDSLERIEKDAFNSCYCLCRLTIPKNVKSIDKSAFDYCDRLIEIQNLSSVDVEEIVENVENVYTKESLSQISQENDYVFFYDKNENIRYLHSYTGDSHDLSLPEIHENDCYEISRSAFSHATTIRSVKIANGTKEIGNSAFMESSISKIIIASSVTDIEDYAFHDCNNLIDVHIPNGVKTIGSNVFSFCYKLEHISLPQSIESMGDRVLCGCKELVDIRLPDNLKTIEEETFYSCSKLKEISIPESVTKIGKSAFENCEAMTEITIPDNVEIIEDAAFKGCLNLQKITIGKGVKRIGKDAFNGCVNLRDVVFSVGIKVIPSDVFSNLFRLENITIPSTVSVISAKAFSGCLSLKQIVFPGSLKKIGSQAFCDCFNLRKITFENGLDSIENSAFSNCKRIQQISLPKSVSNIHGSAFSGCECLEAITVAEENTIYRSDGNCLIHIKTSKIILGCKNSVISTNCEVTSLGTWAFAGSNGLTSINIPKNIVSIGQKAFSDCNSLKEINYAGTKEDWNAMTKTNSWNIGQYTVFCSDGTIER